VEDIKMTLSVIKGLMGNHSTLICSGPVNYPYHPNPIDNMFRPKTRDYFEKYIGELKIEEFNVYRNGMNIFLTLLALKSA
jgi:hypothetical protein